MTRFTLKNAPSQQGKIAIVTGANDGIGYETALGLVSKGAKLIVACRNPEKADAAIVRMKKDFPEADISFIQLDLNSLKSVRNFADEFKRTHQKLDILINNAGIMVPPFAKTAEGFESQMGVNYLAHFLLTGLLIKELNLSDNGRVVSLSSVVHKSGKIDFDNLNAENGYSKSDAYSQSKLACLMFAYELDRRLKESDSNVVSVGAHPGGSVTNLVKHMSRLQKIFLLPIFRMLSHAPKEAALPSLMGALDSKAKGGDYFGPTGFGDISGKPGKVKSSSHSYDKTVAKKLWDASEKLVDFKFVL